MNPEYDGLQVVGSFPVAKVAHPVHVAVVDAARNGGSRARAAARTVPEGGREMDKLVN